MTVLVTIPPSQRQRTGLGHSILLTESVTALQLEQLAAPMDERKYEHLEMFEPA